VNPGASVRIVLLYPDLLGTYGDGGNAVVLAKRLAWRGHAAEVVEVPGGQVAPDDGHVYLLGGGEDAPQVEAARALDQAQTLHRAVERGAVVLGVCAGMQILGHTFPGSDGTPRPGLGLLDVETVRTDQPRAVGELVARADDRWGLAELTGFENHAGRTRLGSGATPLGAVEVGEGNGGGTEGAVSGRVVGTYLHGPALARNPGLADLLAGWAVGRELEPLDDGEVDALRRQRLRAARAAELQPRRSWKDVLRRG
jgi:CobQ-like glutamine amidotransferase family enzyme